MTVKIEQGYSDLLRLISLSSLSSGDSWSGDERRFLSPFCSGLDNFPGRVWYLLLSGMSRFCSKYKSEINFDIFIFACSAYV